MNALEQQFELEQQIAKLDRKIDRKRREATKSFTMQAENAIRHTISGLIVDRRNLRAELRQLTGE